MTPQTSGAPYLDFEMWAFALCANRLPSPSLKSLAVSRVPLYRAFAMKGMQNFKSASLTQNPGYTRTTMYPETDDSES
jgi:hypothetical protein